MDRQHLGETMRRRREEQGLTVPELAAVCEATEADVLVLEEGAGGAPAVALLGRVAEVLGYPSALALLTSPGETGGGPTGDDETAAAAAAFLRGQTPEG